MDSAIVAALIAAVVSIITTVIVTWAQGRAAKQRREDKAKERRSDAKVVLDRYRGPLLDAAWQLGVRLDDIRERDFFAYLSDDSGRAQDAKLTTLFRVANYLGWRKYVAVKSSCCGSRMRRTQSWLLGSSVT